MRNIRQVKESIIWVPVTEELIGRFGTIIGIVDWAERLTNNPPEDLKGLCYIRVVGDPDRIKIAFDPKLTSESAVTDWFKENGILK